MKLVNIVRNFFVRRSEAVRRSSLYCPINPLMLFNESDVWHHIHPFFPDVVIFNELTRLNCATL